MDDYEIMYKSIYNIPEDILEIVENLKDFYLPEYEFEKILFLGTGGGSRASFDILSTYLFDKSKYPILIYQGYDLPKFVDQNTLVIACSYSGDTEETIESLKKSFGKTEKFIVFSSDGEMEKISFERKLPFFKLKGGYEARQALHIIFFSILLTLGKLLKINFMEDIDEVIKVLKLERENIHPEVDEVTNEMKGRVPLIYGSYGFSDSIAERFRRQLNENGKMISHSNIIPNLHHDEIVGFMDKNLKDLLYIILLRDHFEDEKIKKRFEITKRILREYGYKVREIYSVHNNFKLARMFSLVMKVDFISIKYAQTRGFNPKDVEIIKRLKELMKQ